MVNRQNRLVDPLRVSRQAAARAAESVPFTETAGDGHGVSHEVHLDPPAGVQVQPLRVAGSYRHPVPILFDYGTRTAYPMRTD